MYQKKLSLLVMPKTNIDGRVMVARSGEQPFGTEMRPRAIGQNNIVGLLIALMALLLLSTACSPSAAEKLNQQGNDAYAEQAFEQALAMYQAAQLKEPELAEPYYNAASSLYRQGEYEAALQQLQTALTFAEDESLAQSSLFNLGNASYNAQESSTAVAAYIESLLLNPDDQDAKYNLELALQQQQQQEQEQEQQEEQQEEQEQSENGAGQEEEQEQSEEQQDPSEGGEGQEEENQDQQNQDQSKEDQKGEQEQESQDSEQQDQGQQEEGEQQEQPGQGQPQPGEENPDGEQQPNYVPQPGERMTAEQAEQLLAAIAQESDTLQERLGQMFVVPWQPPVQDW